MLEELLEEKKAEISKKAEQEVKAVKYIVDLINENPDFYANACLPVSVSEADKEKRIYDVVLKTIEKLSDFYINSTDQKSLIMETANFKKYRIKNKPDFFTQPEFILGWAKSNEDWFDSLDENPDMIPLTDEGFEIINGYREAKGLPYLEDSRNELKLERNRSKVVPIFQKRGSSHYPFE